MTALHRSVLSNGLPVLVQPLEGTRKITIALSVRAGSRYENRKTSGLSHVLEHMFFRGGERYPDEFAVGSAVDGYGGRQNAFTSQERVYYYVMLPQQALKLGLDLMSDMLINAQLRASDLEKERGPIGEELNAALDEVDDRANEAQKQALYDPRSPLSWDILGPRENIEGFTRGDLVAFTQDYYAANNAALVIAGAVDPAVAHDLAETFFSPLQGVSASPVTAAPLVFGRDHERIVYHSMDRRQAWIALGQPTVQVTSAEGPTLRVLTSILGGGLSSRLFIRIRSEQGLAYATYASLDGYSDHGRLTAWAGVDPKNILKAITGIIETCQSLYLDADEEEYQRKIDGAAYSRIMTSEGADAVAGRISREELVYGSVQELEAYYSEFSSVTPQQIVELAERLFSDPTQLRLGIAGGVDEETIQRIQNEVGAFVGSEATLLAG